MNMKWFGKVAEQKITVVNPEQFTQIKFLTNADEVKQELDSVTEKIKNLTSAVHELRAELETLESVSLKINVEVKEPK